MFTRITGGIVLLAALAACGDDSADTQPSAEQRVCAALQDVDEATVAGDEATTRAGFQEMLDAAQESDDATLAELIDGLRDAEGTGDFALALLDLNDYCESIE